jgi:hypothetical protein
MLHLHLFPLFHSEYLFQIVFHNVTVFILCDLKGITAIYASTCPCTVLLISPILYCFHLQLTSNILLSEADLREEIQYGKASISGKFNCVESQMMTIITHF